MYEVLVYVCVCVCVCECVCACVYVSVVCMYACDINIKPSELGCNWEDGIFHTRSGSEVKLDLLGSLSNNQKY